jgi:hypothetical protein
MPYSDTTTFVWRKQHGQIFMISNFRLVLNVIFFVLGDCPASELYVPTFRTLSVSHLHGWFKQDWYWCKWCNLLTPPTNMERTDSVPKRRYNKLRRRGITQNK